MIVATTVWQSFLGGPDAPDVLPKGLIGMLRREYVPVAKVPIDARDDVASLRPEDGEALWAASPQLSDPRVWGSLVVFERRDRAGGT